MKIDQLAFYAHNEAQADAIKKEWGLADKEWIHDDVTGNVMVKRNNHSNEQGESTAHLQFNYDLGIEFEILTFTSGPHWHEERHEFIEGLPFLSHIGVHMDGEETAMTNGVLVQAMQTHTHTNPYLIEKKRTYHYAIYNTHGTFVKYIWRIQR